MSSEISKEAFFARVREQAAEVKRLRGEYVALVALLEEKSKPLPEIEALKDEIAELRKELARVSAAAAKVPEKYRMEKEEPHAALRHPDETQRLFEGEKSKKERSTGRIKLVKDPKEFICHPLPNEIPQKCKTGPVVIARVTCEFKE